jgi:hypothetical protein
VDRGGLRALPYSLICVAWDSAEGSDVPLQLLRSDAAQLADADRRDDAAHDQVEHGRSTDAEAVGGFFDREQQTLPRSLARGAAPTAPERVLSSVGGNLPNDHCPVSSR